MLLVGLSIDKLYCTGDAVIAKVPVVMHYRATQPRFPETVAGSCSGDPGPTSAVC